MMTAMQRWYPVEWAEDWDRVGLVVGDPAAPVGRILFAVDCVPETVAQAIEERADLLLTHHPLLLHGVSSVATTTYKGRLVHDLIRNDVALFVAHTNADVADPGVSDALAARLGLRDTRPLRPTDGSGRGHGRVGELPEPVTLAEFT
ncbi:MAG: Nif3-like dinuclear metal center hexameric protein, partial [Actinocatenispora sp.]